MTFYVIIAILVILLGLFLLYISIKNIKTYRMIKNLPTSPIEAMSPGLVEIKGKVYNIETIKTPISKKDAVYYHLKIERYMENKNNSGNWQTIYNYKTQNPFFVKDETGEVKISPLNADVFLKKQNLYKKSNNLFTNVFNLLKTFQNKNIEDMDFSGLMPLNNGFNFFTPGDLRYTEEYIEQNDDIYVLGNYKQKDNIKTIEKGTEKIMIISTDSEKNITKRYIFRAIAFL